MNKLLYFFVMLCTGLHLLHSSSINIVSDWQLSLPTPLQLPPFPRWIQPLLLRRLVYDWFAGDIELHRQTLLWNIILNGPSNQIFKPLFKTKVLAWHPLFLAFKMTMKGICNNLCLRNGDIFAHITCNYEWHQFPLNLLKKRCIRL